MNASSTHDAAFDVWADALHAAALLATDPIGLKGAVMRAQPGPAREAWLAALKTMLGAEAPMRRAPAHIDDEALHGGLDLPATLAAGRPVQRAGLLSACDGGALVLAMAERCAPATGARIAAALDAESLGFIVVALDEGAEPDERTPDVLAERLAFSIDLNGVRPRGASWFDRARIAQARDDLQRMNTADDRLIESICAGAGAFGVGSARAALFTLRAARAAAALAGRGAVAQEDLELAARLVLAPRACIAPAETPVSPPSPAPDEATAEMGNEEQSTLDGAGERVVDAVRSALPEEFLAQFLETRTARRTQARARGAGERAKSARRGRPMGARVGALRSGDRLDLVATLRAAAPWQSLRRQALEAPSSALVIVRRHDFRIRRFMQRLESTIIVAVDASGSTALQRLAEAKGAVETLLADAYVTRARIALIAFRDVKAELLLPPTRSLSRAKRALAELPGGGTTPLAAAIETAAQLAHSERAKGRTPLVVLLTDGRGNVSREGIAGRAQAEADAMSAAQALRAAQVQAVFIDTSPRQRPDARDLAAHMGAAYTPLPFVEARAVAQVVRAHAPSRR